MNLVVIHFLHHQRPPERSQTFVMSTRRSRDQFSNMKLAKKSTAWEHFKIENDGEKCKYCNAVLRYTSSTTSLLYHLNSRHPGIIRAVAFSCGGQGKPGFLTFSEYNRHLINTFVFTVYVILLSSPHRLSSFITERFMMCKTAPL